MSHITLLSRRPLPEWAVLPPNASEKTTTIVHNDFLTYPAELAKQLAEADAVVWALGRSAVGMTEQDYTEMTHNFPVNAAKALKEAGAGEGRSADNPFRFVYVSGEGSDPTEKSSQMWARVKVRCHRCAVRVACLIGCVLGPR